MVPNWQAAGPKSALCETDREAAPYFAPAASVSALVKTEIEKGS